MHPIRPQKQICTIMLRHSVVYILAQTNKRDLKKDKMSYMLKNGVAMVYTVITGLVRLKVPRIYGFLQ